MYLLIFYFLMLHLSLISDPSVSYSCVSNERLEFVLQVFVLQLHVIRLYSPRPILFRMMHLRRYGCSSLILHVKNSSFSHERGRIYQVTYETNYLICRNLKTMPHQVGLLVR